MILNIDTATEYASLALSNKDYVIVGSKNEEIRDHASWLHSAIQELMIAAGHSLTDLQAIAITAGPGSYTGLRVGMAAAKGLCYVLRIPLIMENTLKVMACAAIRTMAPAETGTFRGISQTENLKRLFVPMIDARRMEVFTAVYDEELKEVMPPVALILDAASFDGVKADQLVCFGNGSFKFQPIAPDVRFQFVEIRPDASALCELAYQKFRNQDFADLAYAEPLYLKEFYSPAKK